jgi:hypothetical protein
MKYGSVCSGIEAASSAWHSLGWQPAFFSEIEPFPRAVLSHHYPSVPLHGDFTTIGADQYGAIDLLVGGTPCQSFSIAGLRGGLDDDRGNLALEFLRLAQRTRAKWLVWENVPGVLSSGGGGTLVPFSEGWLNSGMGSPTECLTLNTSEWPSAAAVCSLSDVLETQPVPQRFFLSAKACHGILRRASRRDRGLAGYFLASREEGREVCEKKKAMLLSCVAQSVI